MASGYMFSHYWPGDGQQNAVPETPKDTYHQFQGIVVGMTLLPIVWVEGFFAKTRLLYKLSKLIFSLNFERAIKCVELVARVPDMNNGKAWGDIGQHMGQQLGVGENIFRHLLANKFWGPEVPGERVERDVLLHLAWMYHKKPRS